MRTFLIFFLFVLTLVGCSDMNKKESSNYNLNFTEARNGMVKNQIEFRGVKDDRILSAMRKVPRHLFLPERLRKQAYHDEPLPIGHGQTISQPYIVAYMTEQLNLDGDEHVLEIGTGSGYQAAILAELAREVYSIEIVPELGEHAKKILAQLGYKNVHMKIGDGYQGWMKYAPFDAIIVTAAPDHIPQPLIDQLKIGGKMIIPVGDFNQELILLEKTDKGVEKRKKLPVRFVPMTGEAETKE